MRVVPLTRDEAMAFVVKHHRHCKRAAGRRAALGCVHDDRLVGVVILARPCRALQADEWLVEVTRLCVAPDAPMGACSWLYGKARRAAVALGFARVTTMTLEGESGASLRGAGWQLWATRKARPGYHCPSRPRNALPTDNTAKRRWLVEA